MEWWQKCPLRSECDFRATNDCPYNTTQKRATDDRPYNTTQKGRLIITPTNNVCPVFGELGHCSLRSECGYNLPYKQLSLFSYFNSLILNSPFSYIIYVCGLPPFGIETEPGFKYVKSPISSFARICV